MTRTLIRKLSQHGSPQGGLSARALIWSEVVHPGQYTANENIQINFTLKFECSNCNHSADNFV